VLVSLTGRTWGCSADNIGAPRLDITGGRQSKAIVGQVGNVGLDSWDIAHALSESFQHNLLISADDQGVQSQVSSPIRSHPAIHAQCTGSAGAQWPMPSQPLDPQLTGRGGADEIMSASKGEEGILIKNDLYVRSLSVRHDII
jgi:hypothetical protein